MTFVLEDTSTLAEVLELERQWTGDVQSPLNRVNINITVYLCWAQVYVGCRIRRHFLVLSICLHSLSSLLDKQWQYWAQQYTLFTTWAKDTHGPFCWVWGRMGLWRVRGIGRARGQRVKKVSPRDNLLSSRKKLFWRVSQILLQSLCVRKEQWLVMVGCYSNSLPSYPCGTCGPKPSLCTGREVSVSSLCSPSPPF